MLGTTTYHLISKIRVRHSRWKVFRVRSSLATQKTVLLLKLWPLVQILQTLVYRSSWTASCMSLSPPRRQEPALVMGALCHSSSVRTMNACESFHSLIALHFTQPHLSKCFRFIEKMGKEQVRIVRMSELPGTRSLWYEEGTVSERDFLRLATTLRTGWHQAKFLYSTAFKMLPVRTWFFP